MTLYMYLSYRDVEDIVKISANVANVLPNQYASSSQLKLHGTVR